MNLSEIIFRLSFVVLNLVIMVGGIILIIVGSVLISTSSALLQEFNSVVSGAGSFNYTLFLNSAIILIIVGLILLVIGLVGSIGAIKHKIIAFLLMGYMVVLAIIIVLEIVGVILAFVYQAQVIEAIRNDFGSQIIAQYAQNDTGIQRAVDFIQIQLHCCGINNYTDYTNLSLAIPASCSCRLPEMCIEVMTVMSPSIYSVGCLSTAEALLNNLTYQYVLGGIGIAFLVFEIALLLFALCIIFMDLKGDD